MASYIQNDMKRTKKRLIGSICGIVVACIVLAVVFLVKFLIVQPLKVTGTEIKVLPLDEYFNLEFYESKLTAETTSAGSPVRDAEEFITVLNPVTALPSKDAKDYARVEVTVNVENKGIKGVAIGDAAVNGVIGKNIYYVFKQEKGAAIDPKSAGSSEPYVFFVYRDGKSDEQICEQFKKMALVCSVKCLISDSINFNSKINADLRNTTVK